jgi:lipopolysaccharide transport system ATP-binding protein
MNSAITVENLSKRYQIGVKRAKGYRTLRESISDGFASLGDRLRRERRASAWTPHLSGTHWALKDVSFEIQPGEVVGIIGRNGAGKSTLLKILSRITEPTSGRAQIRGRIGSLLEVGTGFHPELTGRENIFLNGSILGMSRREISRRFDEIVAFSEIEEFLDTPVKRYSSGMYVRLAFAVAAHLEPEVLMVDEVLAVGDAAFQKKCLGQMDRLAHDGRTVLFVSHDTNAIAKLTKTSLLMAKGSLVLKGNTDDVIRHYISTGGDADAIAEWERSSSSSHEKSVFIQAVRVRNAKGLVTAHFRADEPITVELCVCVLKNEDAQIAFRLNKDDGTTVFTSALSDSANERSTRLARGTYLTQCQVPAPLLIPGFYHILVAANNFKGPQHDIIQSVLNFEVSEIGSPKCHDGRLGSVAPIFPWEIAQVGAGSTSG